MQSSMSSHSAPDSRVTSPVSANQIEALEAYNTTENLDKAARTGVENSDLRRTILSIQNDPILSQTEKSKKIQV